MSNKIVVKKEGPRKLAINLSEDLPENIDEVTPEELIQALAAHIQERDSTASANKCLAFRGCVIKVG